METGEFDWGRLGPSGSLTPRPEVRSREELFRQTCAVILDPATWEGGGVAIAVAAPLTPADVRSAFAAISEKFRVSGVDLRFDRHGDARVHAVFEPTAAVAAGSAGPANAETRRSPLGRSPGGTV